MLLAPVFRLLDPLRRRLYYRRLPETLARGRHAEDLAHRYLEDKGYTVIQRNWKDRRKMVEVDLLAWSPDQPARLVFVEVKSRYSREFAAPERNLSREQIRNLLWAAEIYCDKGRIPLEQARFDVVAVVFTPTLDVEHNVDAFSFRAETW